MSAEGIRAMRRHVIAALERRAAGHDGDARRRIEAKLAALRDEAAGDCPAGHDVDGRHAVDARGPLGGLVHDLAAQDATRRPSYPDLPALDDFRRSWSLVRTESQLRQSVQPVPEHAGPLNSTALVHRSITLMRDLSPGYLRHFLAYIDDLSWLERTGSSPAAAPREVPQPATIGKRAPKKARARRE